MSLGYNATDLVLNYGLPLLAPALGKVVYVSSVYGLNTNDGKFQTPVATIGRALTLVGLQAQNRDDVIIVLPGHTETISSALTISRAGVRIMGVGMPYRQPKITLSGASTTLNITGAGIALSDLTLTTETANTTAAITVGAGGLTTVRVMIDESGGGSFIDVYKTTTTSSSIGGLRIIEPHIYCTSVNNDNAVNLTSNTIGTTIINGQIRMGVAAGEALIETQANVLALDILVKNNDLVRYAVNGSDASIIALTGNVNNTGMVAYNNVRTSQSSSANIVTAIAANGCGLIQNFGVGENGKSGILIPTADAD